MTESFMEEKRATPSSNKPAPNKPELDTPSKWMKLWRAKWLIVAFSLGAALVALMLGTIEPRLYQAQTSVELRAPAASDAYPRTDDSTTPEESFVQTQLRVIKSRSLVERTLSKLTDEERSRIIELPRFWWIKTSPGQAVESVVNRLSTRPSEQQPGIVDIYFLSPDPVAGAHFLNLLTQELSDLNVERSWHAAQRNHDWTDRQLEELRRKWEQSELALAAYTQGGGSGSQQANRSNRQGPPSDAGAQPSSYAIVSPGPSEADDTKLRQLTEHLADLNKQIAQWESLYGSSAPNLAKLKSDATATEASIRQRRAAWHTPPGTSSRPITGLDKSQNDDSQLSAPTVTRAQSIAHFNVLRQEADTNRRLYETMAERLKEAAVSNTSQIGDINVVDPAAPPSASIARSQLLNGGIGALTGLVFGLLFVLLKDRLSPTFSEPNLLSQQLSLDVLGAIPVDRIMQPASAENVEEEPRLSLTFARDPQTAEAYRSIRSSILFRADQGSGPKRLVFTSATASEGKSTVVGNLGAALASAQRRVLLVDGDLRNPGLHKLFGTDNEHGLTDLLTRQLTAKQMGARDVIRETQIPDLYLLSAGQAGARAPEILSSVQLPELIREFAKAFDIVLIDSSPVLPYADARSLAGAADAVILIIKAGATNRRAALLARDAIAQDGVPIMGTILTDCDVSQAALA